MSKSFISLTVSSLLLIGCGGGSESDDNSQAPVTPPVPVASAEGFWTGTTSNGRNVNLAVLENGETWGFYTTPSNVLLGALYGTTTTSGNTITGSGLDFSDVGVIQGSFSGTFSTKNTLNVSTSGGVTINASYQSEYEQPASLSALAGTFGGYATTGSTSPEYVVATIATDGRITAGNSACSLSGTVLPRSSGKNIFNLTVTFTGSFCALGSGTTVRGVVYYEAPTRSLIAMGLNGAKSDGFVYLASK